MYVGSIGARHVHLQKMSFKKRNSVMAWKKMQVRGTNARYAYVEKIRVITP
jgi:hypothetical protein